MERNKAIVFITVFFIMTACPYFSYFFLGQFFDAQNYENRESGIKPVLSVKDFTEFPAAYESYLNDNIPFRNQLIRLNSSIDYYLFHQSSNDSVEVGKHGWLFYCDQDDGNPIEQSLGYWTFTDEQLHMITENLISADRLLKSRGIEFVLFVAPNKETIYKEELPDWYRIESGETSTDQLIHYLRENTDISVVYPKEELLEAKKSYKDMVFYHKLDTHWNAAGGYIGAKALAEELGVQMTAVDQLTWEPVLSSEGDLTNMLNIKIKKGDIDYRISEINTSKNKYEDFEKRFMYHTMGADERIVFIKRDSFSNALAPFFSLQFQNSIWVHHNDFEQQQIFENDADIFVLETVERYLENLIYFDIEE